MSKPKLKATLIGVPLDLGAKNLGVDIGPEAFRYRDIVAKLDGAGVEVEDAGNVSIRDRSDLTPGDLRQRYLDEIVRVSKSVAKLSEAAVRQGRKVIGLGGDHSVTLGLFAGAAKASNYKIGMIYFDAHGDMNTFETSLTGNIHGMHLAALMGFGNPDLVNIHGQGSKLAKTDLLHIGGNDFDQAELDLVQRENLVTFSLFNLLSQGLAPLVMMIDDLASRVDGVWVSLDLDSIDSTYAPGAGMPSMAGLSYREIAAIADYVGKHCQVIGVDIVEYNPLQDMNHKTAELGIELIAKFLGTNYSWYTNYMADNAATK